MGRRIAGTWNPLNRRSWENSEVMTWKRVLALLVAASLVTLIAVGATKLYVVRELLAALLMFFTLLSVIGILGLVSLLLGDSVVRCAALLAACAPLFHSRRPEPSVVGPLAHGTGRSRVAWVDRPLKTPGPQRVYQPLTQRRRKYPA